MPPPSDHIEFPIGEVVKGLIEMFWAFSPLYPYFAGFLVLVALFQYFHPDNRRRPRKRRKAETVIYIVNQNNIDTKERKK